MNRIILLSSALFLRTCGHPPPDRAPDCRLQSPESLRPASGGDVESRLGTRDSGSPPAQEDEATRLRAELVQARLENLELKLKLARLAQKPGDELRLLEEALASDLPELAQAAFRELSALPENRRKEALPAVLLRLAAGAESFRVLAVAFLGRVPGPEAEDAVLRSGVDPSPAVRKAAASALKSAAGGRAETVLLSLLQDGDREVRLAAIDALGVAKRDSAVKPLLELLASEKDPQIAEKTVDALGVIGAPAAVEDLSELLGRTTRDSIQWSCLNSLGRIGDARAAVRVRPFVKEGLSLNVRLAAIETLGKLKDSAALPRISEILRGDREERLRQAAAEAIGLMAPTEAIEATLLPAYLEDASDPVRRAAWGAILAAAGDRFAPNERLVRALLKAGRRPEADQVCTRIHAAKVEPETRAGRIAIEEAVSAADFQAGDFKAALPHYRQLAALAPERADVARRIAACYRGLDDLDSCLKTLADLKDPEPLIEEAQTLLATPLAGEKKKHVEAALRAAALRLVEPLAGRDEPAKKAAHEALRRQGRRILSSLAAELEENPKASHAVLEAGSAITGIPLDASANGQKARAAAWRAWLEKK